MDDVCNGKVFNEATISLCQGLTEGTLTVGLSKAINYLANTLAKLSTTVGNDTLAHNFHDLILLEYQFIFPLVEHMSELIYREVQREANDFASKYSTIAIVMMVLIGVNFLYFLRYPAYEIEEQIQLSKGLIDLLPEFYKN